MKRNTRLFFLLLIFCAIPFSTFAQVSTRFDAVLLKNGSFLKGEIRMNEGAAKLFIKTIKGSLLEVNIEEVLTIQFDVEDDTELRHLVKRTRKKAGYDQNIPEEGRFCHRLALGLLMPLFNSGFGEALSYTFAYRFHHLAQLGIGGGFDLYSGDSSPQNYIGLHLEYRSDFRKKSSSPFFALKIGPSANFRDHSIYIGPQYRFKFNPTLGMRFASKGKAHIEASGGYLLESGKHFYTENNGNYGSFHFLGAYVSVTF